MNIRQQARVDAFKRAKQFGKDYADDFKASVLKARAARNKVTASKVSRTKASVASAPANGATKGQQLFAELAAIIAAIESKHTVQEGGEVDAANTDKTVLRDALMSDLRLINGSVNYISEE